MAKKENGAKTTERPTETALSQEQKFLNFCKNNSIVAVINELQRCYMPMEWAEYRRLLELLQETRDPFHVEILRPGFHVMSVLKGAPSEYRASNHMLVAVRDAVDTREQPAYKATTYCPLCGEPIPYIIGKDDQMYGSLVVVCDKTAKLCAPSTFIVFTAFQQWSGEL